jgi:hypothetical protein
VYDEIGGKVGVVCFRHGVANFTAGRSLAADLALMAKDRAGAG